MSYHIREYRNVLEWKPEYFAHGARITGSTDAPFNQASGRDKLPSATYLLHFVAGEVSYSVK